MKNCCLNMWNKIAEARVNNIEIESNYCPQCGNNYADMLAKKEFNSVDEVIKYFSNNK